MELEVRQRGSDSLDLLCPNWGTIGLLFLSLEALCPLPVLCLDSALEQYELGDLSTEALQIGTELLI